MIAVVSDTHGSSDHRLEGHTADAVREADLVLHAGDFTTKNVFAGFEREATDLRAVYGNNDAAELAEHLPATRVIDLASEGFDSRVRIALCHGHEHSETALSLLGRQSNATLVVSGHSHQPGVTEAGDLVLLNPGSHADPRWNRPAHAELDVAEGGGLDGRLREPDGTVFETFTVSPLEK
ncbi:YfcE family phosphodiesterase [Halobacteriales archaeon QS_3_64_16]|nr:MAG: YfcE family phosphodiesterase [Halobacteriales archaeon QS_3_64_16]